MRNPVKQHNMAVSPTLKKLVDVLAFMFEIEIWEKLFCGLGKIIGTCERNSFIWAEMQK